MGIPYNSARTVVQAIGVNGVGEEFPPGYEREGFRSHGNRLFTAGRNNEFVGCPLVVMACLHRAGILNF